MKTIQELIIEKTANFEQLLASREKLIEQLNGVNQTLIQLQGHIEGLKAAASASQDPSPDSDQIETTNG